MKAISVNHPLNSHAKVQLLLYKDVASLGLPAPSKLNIIRIQTTPHDSNSALLAFTGIFQHTQTLPRDLHKEVPTNIVFRKTDPRSAAQSSICFAIK